MLPKNVTKSFAQWKQHIARQLLSSVSCDSILRFIYYSCILFSTKVHYQPSEGRTGGPQVFYDESTADFTRPSAPSLESRTRVPA